jgi:hypothetical protein
MAATAQAAATRPCVIPAITARLRASRAQLSTARTIRQKRPSSATRVALVSPASAGADGSRASSRPAPIRKKKTTPAAAASSMSIQIASSASAAGWGRSGMYEGLPGGETVMRRASQGIG